LRSSSGASTVTPSSTIARPSGIELVERRDDGAARRAANRRFAPRRSGRRERRPTASPRAPRLCP
jgi:hypothetical protein